MERGFTARLKYYVAEQLRVKYAMVGCVFRQLFSYFPLWDFPRQSGALWLGSWLNLKNSIRWGFHNRTCKKLSSKLVLRKARRHIPRPPLANAIIPAPALGIT